MRLTKRGRPRKYGLTKDYGTPELAYKRAFEVTYEPLDILLSKNLITHEQQSAGLRFRWLYTVLFGPPTIKSYDPGDLGGRYTSKYTDEIWIKEKEEEYSNGINKLKQKDLESITKNVCIYNIKPTILNLNRKINYISDNIELIKIQKGLDILEQTLDWKIIK